MAPRVYRKTSGQCKDDETYMCYEFALDSFIGTLEDDFHLEEADVKDYIRYNNPKLYERLHHLPFASSDIPQSYQAQRQFKRAFEVKQSTNVQPGFSRIPMSPRRHVHEAVGQIETSRRAPTRARYTFDTMKMELKIDIQTKLINGCILVLKKHPPQYHPLNCENPTCGSYGLVHSSSFYLTLRLSYFTSDDTFSVDHTTLTHYCLCCLEEIFEGKNHFPEDEIGQDTDTALDGVARELVLKTAKRLYNIDAPVVVKDRESISKLVSTDSVSSRTNIDLGTRKQKNEEIEATLAEVDKFEKRRKNSGGSTGTSVSELSISRPYFMEQSKYRYKKQGLSRYDRERMRLQERKRHSISPQVSPMSTSSCSSEDRQCYCREPGESIEDMIQCSNKWCPIGWIHLRCAGIDEPYIQNEDFFCDYCKDGCVSFGRPSKEKKMIELTDSSSAMSLHCVTDNEIEAYEEEEVQESKQECLENERAEEDEQDVTIVVRPSQWGVPVNIQSASSTAHTDGYVQRSFNQSENTTAQLQQIAQSERLDGAESTNFADRTGTDIPSEFIQPTTFEPEQYSDSHLNTFADLASFIFAIDLSANESRVFEQWKNNILERPSPVPFLGTSNSNTLARNSQKANEADRRSTDVEIGEPHKSESLSQLLHYADIQAAGSEPEFQ